MENIGAYISKAGALDALDRMEEEVLWQYESAEDEEVTEEVAIYALRLLNGLRADLKRLPVYCVTGAGVKRQK